MLLLKSNARAQLVELALCNLDSLPYLQGVYEHLLPAVDVACTTEGNTLPAHSYVLMAASPVLGELVATHFANVIKGGSPPEVITVPLTDTTEEAAKTALKYLYQHCSVRPEQPDTVETLNEATALAVFAHT